MALITPTEMSSLSRMSYIDDNKAAAYIEEAEQNDIRRWMGDALYEYVTNNISNVSDLLNGCYYDAQDCCGTIRRRHMGVKSALAYYAYSRIVTGGTIELTRVGVVDRNSDYSYHTDLQNRQQASREAAAIADRYMGEVMDYVKNNETLAAYAAKAQRPNSNRTTLKIIGE